MQKEYRALLTNNYRSFFQNITNLFPSHHLDTNYRYQTYQIIQLDITIKLAMKERHYMIYWSTPVILMIITMKQKLYTCVLRVHTMTHQNTKNYVRFLLQCKGALSKECAGSDDDNDLPDKCNVCSSRMPPLPHPHTPGNMWLARCDYVSKLIDPLAYDN